MPQDKDVEELQKSAEHPQDNWHHKKHGIEAYKHARSSFRHRHGGTQHGAERAQLHLVSNQPKIEHEHHKATHEGHLKELNERDARVVLEEIAPTEYVQKKIDESKPKDDVSPAKGVATVKEADKEDKGTMDEWVPRSNELIRLVGKHPMNAEPPLSTLMQSLITPNSVHYVRNHGAVPKLEWEKHKVSISGLVEKEREFTMDEIKKFPAINIPVTITCDGNRRKELNTIKKSRGFGWGAAATSCSYWKGARLCDILRECGVKSSKDGAMYVCFDGAEKLAKGSYGTSISLNYIMDETNDVMLAYEMNNEPLPADHGFPLRLVIPGYVGGRMVKWLASIKVTEKETDNFFHWHDNKVLPPVVDSTEAIEEGWFYDPNFTLYELNINSVITAPAHDTTIVLDKLPKFPILVEGYSYSGGGRKITRVEISLDEGKTWMLTQVIYPSSVPRHCTKYWTWCHWMILVEPWKLTRAKEIVVRAFDASCNTQPSDPTWNLLGMLNNAWYRVKIDIQEHPTPINPLQPPTLRFIHPVMPGAIPGGWMIKPAVQPLRPHGASWDNGKKYSMEEVKKHNKEDDCWLVFRGAVYNVTSYLRDHPAGPGPILANAGQDVTLPFEMAHGADAYKFLDEFKIGELDTIEPGDTDGCVWAVGAKEIGNITPKLPSKVALDVEGWLTVKLVNREDISPDTRIFTFKHDKPDLPFGLPIGQYVLMGAMIDNKLTSRPYTPISPIKKSEDNGEVKFVVKVYFPKDKIPGGLMTMHLEQLKIGDTVKLRGPYGHVFYEGNGNFLIHGTPLYGDRISLIAGGSGITPCYQIIRKVCETKGDNTEVALVFANKSVKDILLRKELDELAKKHSNFKLWYVVDTKPEDEEWKYGVGHIDYNTLKERIFPAAPNSFAFACGPPAMIEKACLPNLEALGFDFNNLVEF